jgi:glycerophosphoryl diester phosphodiesterase
VAAGVPRLEVDVRFLADDHVIVLHDDRLEGETTGTGPVDRIEIDDARRLRLRSRPDLAPPLLEEVVDLLRPGATVLQVDLKLTPPLSAERVRRLAAALVPLGERAFVGSQGHWNLVSLRAAGARVALDPMLHWHFNPARRVAGLLPARAGLHGLWDDAPLAHLPGTAAPDYFAARLRDLLALVDGAMEWLVDYPTLLHLAGRGVPLGETLSSGGVALSAWTVKDRGPAQTQPLLQSLFAAGVDTIITDDVAALARYLASESGA